MAINLSRSTRLFVSTVKTGNVSANTFEIKILDGYNFSQSVQTQEIVLEEASCTPVRGAKTFNTALDPVEVSFPMYMKPYKNGVESGAVESLVWDAFAGPGGGASLSVVNPYMQIDFLSSDTNNLGVLQLFFQLENTTYLVEDVTVGTADIDFAIDQIAQIAFSGTGTKITEVDTTGWAAGTDYTAEPTLNKEFIRNKLSTIKLNKDSDVDTAGWQIADYQGVLDTTTATDLVDTTVYTASVVIDGVTKALSYTSVGGNDLISAIITDIDTDLGASGSLTVNARGDLQITSATTGSTSKVVITDTDLFSSIKSANFQGLNVPLDGVNAGKEYFFGVTGGTLTLENNITSLVPEELGVVNQPLPAFAGSRSFTGNVTAYLNTGSNKTGGLLNDLLADTNATSNRFYMNIQVGGCSIPKVEFVMPYAQISVPTVSVEDVISTEIGFSASGSEITQSDELTIKYFANLT